jgi:hypothetical protein
MLPVTAPIHPRPGARWPRSRQKYRYKLRMDLPRQVPLMMRTSPLVVLTQACTWLVSPPWASALLNANALAATATTIIANTKAAIIPKVTVA